MLYVRKAEGDAYTLQLHEQKNNVNKCEMTETSRVQHDVSSWSENLKGFAQN